MLPCPEDLVPPALPDPDTPALWAWVGIIVAVVVIEAVLIGTGHSTLSQAVQHQPRWFRWLAIGGVIVLGLHLWGWL